MLLVLLLTTLAGVALVVTLPPSFVCVLSNFSFGDILTCIQTAVIVYAILLDYVVIPYGPTFRVFIRRPLAALAKIAAALRHISSLAKALYCGLCSTTILRVVVCFLVVFLFCLVKLVALSIFRSFTFLVRHATWLFVRRVVAPCILFALSAPIRLTCSIGMYGCTILGTLWSKIVILLLSIPPRLLGRLCEPWSAPPGAFAIAIIDKASGERNKPVPPIRIFRAHGYRTKGIKLPLKQLLSRREKYWDAPSRLSDRTDLLMAATNDLRLDNNSQDLHDAAAPVLALDTLKAGHIDTSDASVPLELCLTAKDERTNDEPKECEQPTSMASALEDNAPASEGNQHDSTLRYSKALVPSSRIDSSLPSSSIGRSFDRSTVSLDTTDLSFASSPTLLTPASSMTSLGDIWPECAATPEPEVDKSEPVVGAQTSTDPASFVNPDAPIQPVPRVNSVLSTESQPVPEPAKNTKPLIDLRAPPPPKFKLPAKFRLSMSCGLFKTKAAPQPKSLPELPVRLQSCSGIKICECDRDVSPLTRQLAKLKLRSQRPRKAAKNMETSTTRSVIEDKPSSGVDIGAQAVENMIKAAENDVKTTQEKAEVPSIGLLATDVANKIRDAADIATHAETGTPIADAPTSPQAPSRTPPTASVATTLVTSNSNCSGSLSGDSGLPTSDPPPASGSNVGPDASEDDPPRLSYFDKGKWPEVDINEVRRELALAGVPMMAANPTLARTSTAPPLPEAVPVLDPAELSQVDPSPRLDGVTQALLSSCDEFGCVVDEQWTDESQGRSFSRSGAPSPELAPSSPVASGAELDMTQVRPLLVRKARERWAGK